jgi:hypothetical protein
VPTGRISCSLFFLQAKMPCAPQPVIVVLLILDLCKRHFLGLGDNFVLRSMLWRFVSGSYWNKTRQQRCSWKSVDWSELNIHKLWLRVLYAHLWDCVD